MTQQGHFPAFLSFCSYRVKMAICKAYQKEEGAEKKDLCGMEVLLRLSSLMQKGGEGGAEGGRGSPLKAVKSLS